MKCDLCDERSGYNLCQQCFDEFKAPEVFSTADGEFPQTDRSIMWDDGETQIGSYDPKLGFYCWEEGHVSDPIESGIDSTIIWCYLPDLRHLYKLQHEPRAV